MVKIVHIGYKYGLNNTGGAAIAATRLHQALLSSGMESHYVCVRQFETGTNVHVLPTGGWRKLYFALAKLTRCVWKFTPYRKSIPLNVIPMFGLEKLLREIDPDVVHVQWINADVVSFEQLGNLRKVVKPTCKIIFNLHDLNMLLAFEAHPQDNRYAEGYTSSNSTRLERWLFARKKRMVEKLNPTFIGPSEYVASVCRKSIIGRDHPVYAISNLIDPIYRFNPELCKPHEKFTILFGSYGGRGNRFKGWNDLVAALKLLPLESASQTEVQVFGEEGPDDEICGIPIKILGNISEPVRLREIYHQADVFVFPSRQETQGMTKCEALCCGLPVIAFDRTACAEGIEHEQTGWIAVDGDHHEFAHGIEYYFRQWAKGELANTRKAIANSARMKCDVAVILDRITKVYTGAVGVRSSFAQEMPRMRKDLGNVDVRFVAPCLREDTRRAQCVNYRLEHELGVESFDNAVITFAGGVIANDEIVLLPPFGIDVGDADSRFVDEEVVFIGWFDDCWGHVVTDCLQRLWFLHSDRVDEHIKYLRFVYAPTRDRVRISGNAKELFNVLGFNPDEFIRIDKPTKFRKVYVPDSCFITTPDNVGRRFTCEYEQLIQVIIDRVASDVRNERRKVYFSRTGWPSKKERGEEPIERLFQAKGYDIVHPEKLSFKETVRLLASTGEFASTDGSCAHNVIFLPKGSRATIVRKANYVNGLQDAICQVRSTIATYIDANRSVALLDRKQPWIGPFLLCVNKRLAAYMGCPSQFRIVECLSYLKDAYAAKLYRWAARSWIGDLKRCLTKW